MHLGLGLQIGGARAFSFSSPSSATLKNWFDPSDGATYSAGTWTNKAPSPLGNWSQAVSGQRPTLVADAIIAGKTAMRFTAASSQYLSGVNFSSLTAGHLFIVVKAVTDAGTHSIWHLTSTPGSLAFYQFGGAFYENAGRATRVDGIADGGADTSQPHLYEVISTSSKYQVLLDGVSLYNNATNTPSWPTSGAAAFLGVNDGLANYFDGWIGDMLTYSTELSTQEAALVRSLAKSRWGTL